MVSPLRQAGLNAIVPIFRNLYRPTSRLSRHESFFSPKKIRDPRRSSRSPSEPRKRSKKSSTLKKSAKEVFFAEEHKESIRDRVALVTGGGDGVGVKCVRELLRCGAKGVMIADTNERWGQKIVRLFCKEYNEDRVAFIRINRASPKLLRHAFLSTIQYFQGLDLVINNVKFKEKKSWEEQVDEYIFMGRQNGGHGGTLVNIISSFEENSESCPLFLATQDFVVGFDRSIANEHHDNSDVKVLTICQATLESVGCDLETVITKGKNGCVWTPS